MPLTSIHKSRRVMGQKTIKIALPRQLNYYWNVKSDQVFFLISSCNCSLRFVLIKSLRFVLIKSLIRHQPLSIVTPGSWVSLVVSRPSRTMSPRGCHRSCWTLVIIFMTHIRYRWEKWRNSGNAWTFFVRPTTGIENVACFIWFFGCEHIHTYFLFI